MKKIQSRWRSVLLWIGTSVVTFACTPEAEPAPEPATTEQTVNCTAPAVTGRLSSELFEASGLSASNADPGLLWALSDDGPPVLFALDSAGAVRGRVQVTGAGKRDWESLAGARCGDQFCLYIGDIGDNQRNRATIAIYRVEEPAPNAAATGQADKFEFRYPDGPHDAEAIFVLPNEQLFVVTKGRSEPISIYRIPGPLTANQLDTLQFVQPLTASFVQLPDMVTGAGATVDGQWVVLRTYSGIQLYRMQDNQLQPRLPGSGVSLEALHESQGEGVDLRADGTVLLLSEKGFGEGPPPLSRLKCALTP